MTVDRQRDCGYQLFVRYPVPVRAHGFQLLGWLTPSHLRPSLTLLQRRGLKRVLWSKDRHAVPQWPPPSLWIQSGMSLTHSKHGGLPKGTVPEDTRGVAVMTVAV